ncbi:hypothetical protein ACPA9J_28930 [Pseudomonas aeruginosa]
MEPSELISGVRKAVEAGHPPDPVARAEHVQSRIPRSRHRYPGTLRRQGATDAERPAGVAGRLPGAGWHLTSAQLRKYASAGRPFPRRAPAGRLLPRRG